MSYDAVVKAQMKVERYKPTALAPLLVAVREFQNTVSTLFVEASLADSQNLVNRTSADIKYLWQQLTEPAITAYRNNMLRLGDQQMQSRRDVLGKQFDLPSADDLYIELTTTPLTLKGSFRGLTLDETLDRWQVSAGLAFAGVIRAGAQEDKNNMEILREIRGTRGARYQDGKLAEVTRNAKAVSNTLVQHVAGSAANLVDTAAGIDEARWEAFLESSTCAICRSLDGRVFKIKEAPRSPAHIGCRCFLLPLLPDGSTMPQNADRPASFYVWLKSQPEVYIAETLGPVRAKLFLDGGMTAKRFGELQLDRDFVPLTLAELEAAQPRMFKNAGI